MRHGGYLGWLLWAVGTQLLLVNPVCTVGFAVAVGASGRAGERGATYCSARHRHSTPQRCVARSWWGAQQAFRKGPSHLQTRSVRCPAAAMQAWVFFRQRVPVEDRLLQQFFGPEFEEYRARVPSGLPWIT